MVNKTESDEKRHLEIIRQILQQAIDQIDVDVKEYARELHTDKKYLYENKADLDNFERFSMRQAIARGAITGDAAVARKERLAKLMKSPFFARIDFSETGRDERLPLYIGIHAYFDEESNENMIYDWRAPVSSLYYDYELGDAGYEAPSGFIKGEILLKRQYRIRNGHLEFMLENASNIYDDILQLELSKSSDEKMKNIVATIQRDQHAIIRNETSRTLIIQGVAGSGKTSIALHRIAFLLYRFKETIKSNEVLIISPNKVFASYISNVLPELGEEMIPEMEMEELADKVLDKKVRFQSFFEQVTQLLERKDDGVRKRMEYKGSFDFLMKLDQYVAYIEKEYFEATDIWIRRNFVPSWFIRERFDAWFRLPVLKRFAEITRDIESNIKFYYDYEIDAAERAEIRKAVTAMYKTTNVRELYKGFYSWLSAPELFALSSRSRLEYADVFPLIYLKIRLEGYKSYDQVKHLLVDEMQDYTPVQYAVLSKLFTCKKTILGDANQTVNPYSSSTAADIQKVFPEADMVMLYKSYRSTFEITRFAQTICRNEDLVAVERHGKEPGLTGYRDVDTEVAAIQRLISDFSADDYRSMGIICKTIKQAEMLAKLLADLPLPVILLSPQSASFVDGIVVTTAHMAKGLEFDHVVVPFVTASNYKTQIDKSMLYIACTRAMHQLTISYSGERSGFLQNGS